MPRQQLEAQLVSELGPAWRTKLADFDYTPAAAASIGQVHGAVLLDGRKVAIKIQYPGRVWRIKIEYPGRVWRIKIQYPGRVWGIKIQYLGRVWGIRMQYLGRLVAR